MEIRAESELSLSDLVDAQLALRSVRRTYFVLAVFVALVLGRVLAAQGASAAVSLVAACAAGVAIYALRAVLQRPPAARNLAGKRPEELRMRYVFDDEGYGVEAKGGSARFAWSALHGWHEGRRTISLLTAANVMQVIPKRALSPADLDALRALLRDHVQPRAAPLALFKGRAVILWLAIVVLFFLFYSLLSRPAH